MTVAELIEKLRDLPQDYQVVTAESVLSNPDLVTEVYVESWDNDDFIEYYVRII